MTKATVDHGICGFTTKISAEAQPDYTVKITLDSDCPNLAEIPEELLTVDPLVEMTDAGTIAALLAPYIAHRSCLCVTAILKVAETEAGLALKKDAGIRFEE